MQATILRATRAAAIFPGPHNTNSGAPRFVFDSEAGERIYVEMDARGYADAELHYSSFVNQAASRMDAERRMRLAESLLSVLNPAQRAEVVNAVTDRWHSPGIRGTETL